MKDIIDNSNYGNDNPLIYMERIGDIMLDACNNPTKENVKKTFAPYSWKVSDIQAQEIADIIQAVRDMPVNMFEVKPQRVVGFDEIANILVPDDTDKEFIAKLEKEGLPVQEYERGNAKDRLEKVNRTEGIAFSRKVGADRIKPSRDFDNLDKYEYLNRNELATYYVLEEQDRQGNYFHKTKYGEKIYQIYNKLVYTYGKGASKKISRIVDVDVQGSREEKQ